MKTAASLVTALLVLTSASVCQAQAPDVTYDRILNAAVKEPHNWLTYNGAYDSQRHSALAQITPRNAKNLELKWQYQGNVMGAWQSSPLVIDGVMYLTQRPNDIVALDAKTGRMFWLYRWPTGQNPKVCCGANNRGLAVLGNRLFMGTLDGYLVAVDATSGRQVWSTQVGDPELGYSLTAAPLVIKDMVLVGVGGGEYGIRGYIAAYDAATGAERWRFHTVPAPGEPGSESWTGDSWKTGGGPVWLTGSYDPALNLTYWGTGNAAPDLDVSQRPGDNLYTASVVALDPDTGKLKWHFQFTPQDKYDYDSVQIPVLVDRDWQGTPRKLMLWANRNGFFYVLDRTNGKFLLGKPFTKLNWARQELDPQTGRPTKVEQAAGEPTYPTGLGATNWYSPSYNPRTGLMYVSIWENTATIYRPGKQEYRPGQYYMGGAMIGYTPVPGATQVPTIGRGPINNWTEATGTGAIIALDPATGTRKWTYPMHDLTTAGILTTASNMLFAGNREGYFHAIDARNGALLWKASLGAQIVSAPITYEIDGTQYVTVISGMALSTFALR